jgi:hypothetical protein
VRRAAGRGENLPLFALSARSAAHRAAEIKVKKKKEEKRRKKKEKKKKKKEKIEE